MRWTPTLLLGLGLVLGAAEKAAPARVSTDDLAELERLRQKMATDDPPAVATPPPPPAKGAMSPEDQAELDALRTRLKTEHAEPATDKAILVQVIRTEVDGLELVLVLDATIPTPVVIQGSGHTLGQKFSVAGTFSGAAKFEGAYYSLLKTTAPVVNAVVAPAAPKEAAALRPVLGAVDGEAEEGFGGFQLSNILFAGFAAISLAIVCLKVKAKVDAMKGRKRRR